MTCMSIVLSIPFNFLSIPFNFLSIDSVELKFPFRSFQLNLRKLSEFFAKISVFLESAKSFGTKFTEIIK